MAELRVTTRNARFQQWQALLTNRAKRQQRGEFLVHGVRPVTMAVRHGWPVRELLYNAQARLSSWATGVLDAAEATTVAVSGPLLAELGERGAGPPELLAVVGMQADDLDRIPASARMTAVLFDRPTSPGNIGTLVRSADAFGASGVVVTGHAADVYDPKAVRASTGSLFSVPVVRAASPGAVLAWVDTVRAGGVPLRLVGTDEGAAAEIGGYDLTRPALVLVGNETSGLSARWRGACDDLVRIPMTGSASSVNAATAASIALYEAFRQRRARPGGPATT